MSYPVLFLRVKAALLDSIIFGVLIFAMVYLSIQIGIANPVLKVAFIVVPVILLEPVMMWLTGGSVGHHYSGIRIIGKNSGQNLFVLNGIVRFIVKTLLGWISLIFMLLTKRHQSFHDILSGSIVVFKNEATASDRHKLMDRQTVYTSQKPSIGRRLAVVIAYLFLALIVFSAVVNLFVSTSCLESGHCDGGEGTAFNVASVIFMVVLIAVIILGFLSKLPGAYYRATKTP